MTVVVRVQVADVNEYQVNAPELQLTKLPAQLAIAQLSPVVLFDALNARAGVDEPKAKVGPTPVGQILTWWLLRRLFRRGSKLLVSANL